MKRSSIGCVVNFLCLLPLLTPQQGRSCGNGPTTVTNIPTLGGGLFQATGLNATGQVTGFSYLPGDTSQHAFLYVNGVTTDLGTLGLNNSIGYALNDLGQVAGEANVPDEIHAALYSGGTWTDLGTLGGSYARGVAINNAGQVAGTSLTQAGTEQAFLYSSGSMTNLGDFGSGDSAAVAMNQFGDVAGYSYTVTLDFHAFLYTQGSLMDLGTLGGNYAYARALNDAKFVVGESSTTNGDVHAFAYSEGAMSDLGALGGTYSTAFAINSLNQILGLGTTTNDLQWRGFFFQNGTLTDLGTLGGDYCSPSALNNLGQVVGDSAISNGASHSFLWQQGTITDLNTLLPEGSGWELFTALFINDNGHIVGTGAFNGVAQWYDLKFSAANSAPIAVAVADQTAQCNVPVTLDATRSYDPDGSALTYQWSEGTNILSSQATAVVVFQTGTHDITLTVADACGAFAQTNLTLTVLDTTAPVIVSAPGPISVSVGADCQAAVPNVLSAVVAADNCTPAAQLVMTQDPVAGSTLGIGIHSIAVTVADASGNFVITNIPLAVISAGPAIQSLGASPGVLSPPNHKMVPVAISVHATLPCGGTPVSKIASITCNESIQPGDIQITGDLTATLAASRDPAGSGRVYTITIQCSDGSAHSTSGVVTVTVPRGKE